jgi:hypothetical protein
MPYLVPLSSSFPPISEEKANKIVDKLANEGVSLMGEDINIDVGLLPAPSLLLQCIDLSHKDCSSPDGVTVGAHAYSNVNAASRHLPPSIHSNAEH